MAFQIWICIPKFFDHSHGPGIKGLRSSADVEYILTSAASNKTQYLRRHVFIQTGHIKCFYSSEQSIFANGNKAFPTFTPFLQIKKCSVSMVYTTPVESL